MNTEIPAGYWQNASGGLTPESLVADIDKLRDQTVRRIIQDAKQTSQVLGDFKARAMSDVETFIDTSMEQYGAKTGGEKGNVTLTSFDGRFKILRARDELLAFDERLQAAKALIDECIRRWTKGTRAEIRALIDNAFQVDRQGNISTGRVLGLRRLKIDDPQWLEAMRAINDALQVVGSKSYIRIYERDEAGKYHQLPLDVARA